LARAVKINTSFSSFSVRINALWAIAISDLIKNGRIEREKQSYKNSKLKTPVSSLLTCSISIIKRHKTIILRHIRYKLKQLLNACYKGHMEENNWQKAYNAIYLFHHFLKS
jgi:hypothetical protein